MRVSGWLSRRSTTLDRRDPVQDDDVLSGRVIDEFPNAPHFTYKFPRLTIHYLGPSTSSSSSLFELNNVKIAIDDRHGSCSLSSY